MSPPVGAGLEAREDLDGPADAAEGMGSGGGELGGLAGFDVDLALAKAKAQPTAQDVQPLQPGGQVVASMAAGARAGVGIVIERLGVHLPEPPPIEDPRTATVASPGRRAP